MKLRIVLCLLLGYFSTVISAHPMPHSIMLLDIKADGIKAQLSLPLKEFQFVFPEEDLDNGYQTLITRKDKWLDRYLSQHLAITDSTGRPWVISITKKNVSENEQPLTGKYHELTFQLWMQAPQGSSPRNFIMHYDVIMHQLVTHKLFIKLNHDWYGGLTPSDSLDTDLGVLSVNPADNTVPPVIINLDEGSAWKGFKTMINLGIEHISEGTDHLLFLFVLLLPATLIVENKRWTGFGGIKYSIIHVLKIVTAFTIGHSVSLLIGSMKWILLPQQPVEIAVAITILITAIHAIRPLFWGKEIFITTAFGIIHGLAFSSVLSEMNLDPKQMAFSILGFNLGIELMQLFVIVCTIPWLIVLSKKKSFQWIRMTGASIAIVASLSWMAERISGQSNHVSKLVEIVAAESKWILLFLALSAILSMFSSKKENIIP